MIDDIMAAAAKQSPSYFSLMKPFDTIIGGVKVTVQPPPGRPTFSIAKLGKAIRAVNARHRAEELSNKKQRV